MGIEALMIYCAIIFAAAIVQGISGFAFIMVVLMVFPYLFGYTQAVALATLIYIVILYYNSYLYRKHIEWKWAPRWVITFIIVDTIGVMFLKKVGDAPIWYTLMGMMFIMMSAYLLWGQKRVSFQPNNFNLMLFAALCGGVNGIFAVGGPIMATFFLVATDSKENYLGTTQILGVFTITIDVIVRAINGMYTIELLQYAAIGIVFAVTGLLVAKLLVRCMNESALRQFVCVVMIVGGVLMLSH